MSSRDISDPGKGGGILVTGGAGFVGVPLVAALTARGPVTVVDDLSSGRPMPPPRPGLTCHRTDIRDTDAMRRLMLKYRPRTVVHLAAIHHIPTCENDPARAMGVNVMGFQSVLDACTASGCARVLLASSGAVYAWADGPLAETSPISPQDVYSASKAANEHQLTAWVRAGHGAGTIARMFNIIGPDDPNGHLIPDILQRLSATPGPSASLRLGNLHSRRDFVDLRDMASGLETLAIRDMRESDVSTYNLCSGTEYTVTDIAELLAAHLGKRIDIVRDPALCRAIDRPGQLGDPSKTLTETGWKPHRPLNDSIAAIVETWKTAGKTCA